MRYGGKRSKKSSRGGKGKKGYIKVAKKGPRKV